MLLLTLPRRECHSTVWFPPGRRPTAVLLLLLLLLLLAAGLLEPAALAVTCLHRAGELLQLLGVPLRVGEAAAE